MPSSTSRAGEVPVAVGRRRGTGSGGLHRRSGISDGRHIEQDCLPGENALVYFAQLRGPVDAQPHRPGLAIEHPDRKFFFLAPEGLARRPARAQGDHGAGRESLATVAMPGNRLRNSESDVAGHQGEPRLDPILEQLRTAVRFQVCGHGGRAGRAATCEGTSAAASARHSPSARTAADASDQAPARSAAAVARHSACEPQHVELASLPRTDIARSRAARRAAQSAARPRAAPHDIAAQRVTRAGWRRSRHRTASAHRVERTGTFACNS